MTILLDVLFCVYTSTKWFKCSLFFLSLFLSVCVAVAHFPAVTTLSLCLFMTIIQKYKRRAQYTEKPVVALFTSGAIDPDAKNHTRKRDNNGRIFCMSLTTQNNRWIVSVGRKTAGAGLLHDGMHHHDAP